MLVKLQLNPQAISAILGPSEQAKKLLKTLGSSTSSIAGQGLNAVLEDTIKATGGSSEKLLKLFGSVEAVNAVLALAQDEFKGVNKNIKNQTGDVTK